MVECPRCGTEMVVESDWTKSNRPRRKGDDPGELKITQRCPNPDCPGNESDLAEATDPDTGAQ